MAKMFEFELVFALPVSAADASSLLDRLFEAGLDDAVIGTGSPGVIAIALERQGDDADSTILAAAEQCRGALPDGTLLREVRPGLICLAEFAEKQSFA